MFAALNTENPLGISQENPKSLGIERIRGDRNGESKSDPLINGPNPGWQAKLSETSNRKGQPPPLESATSMREPANFPDAQYAIRWNSGVKLSFALTSH